MLTGLLRYGRIREDGSVCNRSLGGFARRYTSGSTGYTCRCP